MKRAYTKRKTVKKPYKYYWDHKEEERLRKQIWYAKNKDIVRAKQKIYRDTMDPELLKEKYKRKYQRRKEAIRNGRKEKRSTSKEHASIQVER